MKRLRLQSLARAPLAAQVIALLMVAVLAGQAVSLVMIFTAPPPRHELYRMTDIVAALEGRSLQPPYGQKLIRTLEDGPPQAEGGEPEFSARGRRELAALMRVPEVQVRLIDFGPEFGRHFGRRHFGRPRPPDGFRHDARRDEGFGPGAGPRPERRAGERPIVGDFVAATRSRGGGWIVVRPTPESFPTEWQKQMLLYLVASFLVLAPIGWLFARRISAPLGAFAQAAERLGRDPRAAPMNLAGPAELGAAAGAFNEMQARLRRYVEDRTAMLGAISHDLRTPLARIRFKLEGASPDLRASVGSDVAQMEQMIEAALSFARDATEARPREPVELRSLLECVVDDAALMGADVAMEDAPEGARPLVVEADALGLQRLFANLVDNAVKYGGSARVRLIRPEADAVVEVSDPGPGLSPEELEQVFRPFYRADPARNLDSGGVGLGLSVARTIARAHGGEVELFSRETGLTACVRLPLPAARAS